MSLPQKLKHEFKALAFASLFFGAWIAALLTLKALVLAQYEIEFSGWALVLMGALILSKVVLILEHVPLGARVRSGPAWVDVVLRTALYSAGVAIVLVLEKGFEGRHEHGGFGGAVWAAFQGANADHVWANILCLSGALFTYNALAVVRRHLGTGGLTRLFLSRLPALASLGAVLLLAGCSHLGPKTIGVDRFDYSTAIADSWKQQTLLNIVKLRYMDLPVFVDVASVVAGYSLQTGVNVNGTLSSENAVQGDYLSVGGQAIYIERPTITYVPLTGEKFLRGMITPLDPKNIFFMLQSGYAADFILGLTVESLNGVRNRSTAGGTLTEADPDFIQAMRLMRELQAEGGFGMRVEEGPAKGPTGVVFFHVENMSPEVLAKATEVRRLLKLESDARRFALVYSPARGEAGELAVNSRSMLQIMGAFASHVDVPEAHRENRSALPGFTGPTEGSPDQVRIHSGKDRPAGAFAAVRYRDHWFWIDDANWQTKRALTAVMFFFTLADTGGNEKLPLITIPAQ